MYPCLIMILSSGSLSLAYEVKYTEDTVSLSPLPTDVGRSVFYGRQGWPDNQYYDTYINDPDVGRTTEEYILSRHFKCETHSIVTEDGYILPAYRIINPFSKNREPYPILFTTAGNNDVNQWLGGYGGNAVPPKEPAGVTEGQILNSNLPFALANHGYEPWLFNTRGVGSYLNLTHLSVLSLDYWKFSLDQVAQYDVPAAIKYVQRATNHKHVGYVGYSESTVFMMMALASIAGLNEELKPVILMGFGVVPPTDFEPDAASLLFGNTLNLVALPVLPKLKLTSTALTAFCAPPIQDACVLAFQLYLGYDAKNFNNSRLPVYTSQLPGGTNTWKLAHGYQNLQNPRGLCRFNYGIAGNQQQYGQDESPCYDMTKITNRFIGAFIGKNDLVTPYSENTLSRFGVNPVFEKYVIPYADWNHGDYIYAKTLGRYIVPKVIMAVHRALKSQ